MKKVFVIILSVLSTLVVSAQSTPGSIKLNQSGTNMIQYIDNDGKQSTGVAQAPPALQNVASWIAQWTKQNNKGVFQAGGKQYESFAYRGDDGTNYETRIVATAVNDPKKGFDVRFQSRKIGEKDYKDGRVIILGWENHPWLVSVDYTPARGIFFTFSPYKHE